jgi:hypothetical protein
LVSTFLFFLKNFSEKKEGIGLLRKKSIAESFLEEGEGLVWPEVVCKYFLREGGVSDFLGKWRDGWLHRRLNKRLQDRSR